MGVRKSEGTVWLGQTRENTEANLRSSDSVGQYWEAAGDLRSFSVFVDDFLKILI